MKFGAHDCPACREMAGFDASVAAELGLSFTDVNMKNIDAYRLYRKYLLFHRSGRRDISLPTYILVDFQGDEFAVHGELEGFMPLHSYRAALVEMLEQSGLVESQGEH